MLAIFSPSSAYLRFLLHPHDVFDVYCLANGDLLFFKYLVDFRPCFLISQYYGWYFSYFIFCYNNNSRVPVLVFHKYQKDNTFLLNRESISALLNILLDMIKKILLKTQQFEDWNSWGIKLWISSRIINITLCTLISSVSTLFAQLMKHEYLYILQCQRVER